MNTEDFLYNYAKLYLQFNVQASLLHENWFCDNMVVKDENNIREYVKFRNFVKDNNLSDKKIIQELLFLKQDRIGFIYEKLYNNMIDLLENTRKISDDEKETIKIRLQVYRSLDYVNFQYINELRKIEEENY